MLEEPALAVLAENPACGDTLRLSARLENGIFAAARFQVRGCTASIACGSALTEWLAGRSVADLSVLPAAAIAEQVEQAVGGLPPASRHAAVLAADAVRLLLGRLS